MTQIINDTIELENTKTVIENRVNEIRTNLLKCADSKNGYLHFAKNFFHIQHPIRGKIKFDPYIHQTNLLKSMHEYCRNINELPRQSGKSTCETVYLLWYAMFVPNSTIVVAGHNPHSVREIMRHIQYAYNACPDYIRCGVTDIDKMRISFDNGSNIQVESLTETISRGRKISILCLDEYAWAPTEVVSKFWASLSLTLDTIDKIIITSTSCPEDSENHFASILEGSQDFSYQIDKEKSNSIGRNGFHGYRVQW